MEPKNELQRNAVKAARKMELDTFQRALDRQWMDSRMADGRMGRCLALIKREADMEKDYQERTDHAAIVNSRAATEIALGTAIAEVRREEACQLLRRHLLRENDPELRTLQRKLQAGYVCRDLRQQMLHNQYKRLQEKAEEHNANSVLLDAMYSDGEQSRREEREKAERQGAYRRELQQQMVNREQQRQSQYEDTLIEKKMLDQIMQTLADEDKRELEQKKYLMEKTKHEMAMFSAARRAWKDKHAALVTLEEQNIERQRQNLADRTSAIAAERERKERAKEESNAKIVAKIAADKAALEERTNIIKELQEQEYLENNVQDDMAEREKAERVKKEIKEALTEQMDIKKRVQREQKQMEAEYRKAIEARNAEGDESERAKELKRRERNRAWCGDLLQQIQAEQDKRAAERADEQARAQYVWDCDKKWQAEVSQEREKIVEEHVPFLVGYLQAGVVRREDVPAVRRGAAARPELATLPLEGLDRTRRPQRRPKCNEQCMRLRKY